MVINPWLHPITDLLSSECISLVIYLTLTAHSSTQGYTQDFGFPNSAMDSEYINCKITYKLVV